MADFKKSFDQVLANEGGYVNDPVDPGGETYKGISRKNWPLWMGWQIIDLMEGYPGFPQSLDNHTGLQDEIKLFYQTNFWNKIHGDQITDQAVAESIFDFAVNTGILPAVYLAQKVADTTSDAVIGPKTIAAINSFNPDHFLAAFAIEKIRRYIAICQKHEPSKKYFFGWVSRAVK